MLIRVLVILIFSTAAVSAHHEGITGGPGIAGPLVTFPARTLPKGKFFINTGLRYTHFDTFANSQVNSLLSRGETTGQITHALTPSIGFGYGVTDDFDIYLNLPYIFKYGLIETDAGQRSEFGNSIGLGDLTLLTQYRFYKNYESKLFASLIAGLNIPTGARNVKNDQGDFFGNDDQPGSGSVDPYMGLALSKNIGEAFSFDTNMLYRLSTPGPRGGITGDSLNYNIALSYVVQRSQENQGHNHNHNHPGSLNYHDHHHHHGHHQHSHQISTLGKFIARVLPARAFGNELTWNLITELGYNWQERPELDSVKEDNHGGHNILATEGIRAIVNDNIVINLGVTLPLITAQYGAQPTPLPSIIFGASYLF